ncbi:MAG: AtpZ/AtpI family protein [Bacteriovoracia bacterium]
MLLDPVLLKKTGIFSLVSGELLAFIGGGYWLGSTIDKRWHSAPVFTLVFVFIGLTYSGWRILRLSKEWMKSESDKS